MGSRVLVILAAGTGRRFGGCKQLAPVGPGGETLMDYTIHGAGQAGFDRVVVVIRRELDGPVRAHLADVARPSVALVHQAAGTQGTADAVLAARPLVGDESFGVVNADDLYPLDALRAIRAWDGPDHAVLGFRLADTMLADTMLADTMLADTVRPGLERSTGRCAGPTRLVGCCDWRRRRSPHTTVDSSLGLRGRPRRSRWWGTSWCP